VDQGLPVRPAELGLALTRVTSIVGMAGVDAGDRVPCPSCGETVLQKSMIPVLGEDGTGMRYLCVPCARLLIVDTTEREAGGGPDAGEEVVADPA
jgi:DNA-directed RNA polymerase subunit RPC12/RpoP